MQIRESKFFRDSQEYWGVQLFFSDSTKVIASSTFFLESPQKLSESETKVLGSPNLFGNSIKLSESPTFLKDSTEKRVLEIPQNNRESNFFFLSFLKVLDSSTVKTHSVQPLVFIRFK